MTGGADSKLSTVARHTAERISSQTVVVGLLFLFSALFSLDLGISNMVQTLLFELPNSRTQELEGNLVDWIHMLSLFTLILADRIGLSLMSRACFDPRAAPE